MSRAWSHTNTNDHWNSQTYTDHQIHILYSLCVFEDTDHPEIFIERLVDSRIFWDDQKVITKVGLEQPTHLS